MTGTATEDHEPERGPDATMEWIGIGLGLSRRGERDAARHVFEEVWADIGGEAGDPFHRCALAHAMADVQDDVAGELAWDLRALDAAGSITDGRAAEAGVAVSVRGFLPSLHLNLADCYRRLGDPGRARDHVRRGRDALDALVDDGYRQMVEGGLDRLAGRLPPA
ncbi:MAG: hypothetical protein M3066_02315 [Actinomycetota bacterium]|nr:hypothetical protein [Actinomycetota bacterium]